MLNAEDREFVEDERRCVESFLEDGTKHYPAPTEDVKRLLTIIDKLEKSLDWLIETIEDDFAVEIFSDDFRKKYWEQRKKELEAILSGKS